MADRRALRRSQALTAALGAQARLGGLVMLAAAPILLAAALVPRSAVLVSLSLAAIGIAALAALAAWRSGLRRHRERTTLWDIAGACMLIGCAAAMLCEPENIVQIFGRRN